jgi:hypothetical protein
MSAGHRDTAADDVRFETWTRENGFTQEFWAHEVNGTWGVILPEHLGSKGFLAGMDLAGLAAAFKDLTGRDLPFSGGNMNGTVPTPIGTIVVPNDPAIRAENVITNVLVPVPAGSYPVINRYQLNSPIGPTNLDGTDAFLIVVGGQLVALLARNASSFTPAPGGGDVLHRVQLSVDGAVRADLNV